VKNSFAIPVVDIDRLRNCGRVRFALSNISLMGESSVGATSVLLIAFGFVAFRDTAFRSPCGMLCSNVKVDTALFVNLLRQWLTMITPPVVFAVCSARLAILL